MSETIVNYGILKEISVGLAKPLLTKHDLKVLNDIYDGNCLNCLCGEQYNKYVTADNRLFEIIMNKVNVNYDIFYAHKMYDGNIGFVVKYDNGGCGFEEAISEAINTMENKE